MNAPTMTATQFQAALKALGLDGEEHTGAAARTLGVTTRAIRHWRMGTRAISGPVVILLQVLVAQV